MEGDSNKEKVGGLYKNQESYERRKRKQGKNVVQQRLKILRRIREGCGRE